MSEDKFDVSEWIRFAQMDYDAAVNMVTLHNPVPVEIVCYHSLKKTFAFIGMGMYYIALVGSVFFGPT